MPTAKTNAAKHLAENTGTDPHTNCAGSPFQTLIGDLDAARIRLLRMGELAAKDCDAVSLNALSMTIYAHLVSAIGDAAVPLHQQIRMELDSEQKKDWTLRYQGIEWGKA
jgi:hypothetical protein